MAPSGTKTNEKVLERQKRQTSEEGFFPLFVWFGFNFIFWGEGVDDVMVKSGIEGTGK